jgi:hypothetical protein
VDGEGELGPAKRMGGDDGEAGGGGGVARLRLRILSGPWGSDARARCLDHGALQLPHHERCRRLCVAIVGAELYGRAVLIVGANLPRPKRTAKHGG